MAEFYTLEKETLTNIADVIRLKRDITTEITPEEMPLEISLIEGGSDLPSIFDKIHEEEQEITSGVNYLTEGFYFYHNAGFVPDVIIVQFVEGTKTLNSFAYLCQHRGYRTYIYDVWTNGGATVGYARAENPLTEVDEEKWAFRPYNNGSGRIYANTKVKIVAIKYKQF